MGVCTPVCKCLRRAKYFLLLLISLSVLVWIRTFSGEVVKSFQVSHATTQTLVKGDGLVDKLWTVVPDPTQTEPPKEECPQESPLLRKWAKWRCDVRKKRTFDLWSSSVKTDRGMSGTPVVFYHHHVSSGRMCWGRFLYFKQCLKLIVLITWMRGYIDWHYGVAL